MAEPKTKVNDASVEEFLNSVADEQRRADSFAVLDLMKRITNCEPKMWGGSIIGFDTYHYKYASGQQGDWPITGFSPRKQNLTIYIMPGFARYPELMSRLGKHKTGKSCLYLNKLSDVDIKVLEELIAESYAMMKKKYG